MRISVAKQGDTVILHLGEQLVQENRHDLKRLLMQELGRGERHFRIDLGDTGYIDSSGLGMLVALSKQVREQGGELRLANLNEDLRTLFELTKLDTLFRFPVPGPASRQPSAPPR
jgi:anti-sigma B factor antagonist